MKFHAWNMKFSSINWKIQGIVMGKAVTERKLHLFKMKIDVNSQFFFNFKTDQIASLELHVQAILLLKNVILMLNLSSVKMLLYYK